jgi:3-oxoacyl-[acyl-carrier protein] reductase
MSELDLTGKTVLVVGGTSGLGNGIAQKFREKGAFVHVWGTRKSLSDYDDDRCDYDGLHYQQVDVSKPENIEILTPEFNSLDCLVLSQGIMDTKPYELENFQQVIDINLISFLTCCNKFENMLKASKGSVIMMNSVVSQQAITLTPGYSVAKYGMIGLTKLLAKTWGPSEVRVNGLAPGVIATRMMDGVTGNDEYYNSIVSKQPFGRLGTVDEVANVALFLASPMASYITGQTIYIDGGFTLTDIV